MFWGFSEALDLVEEYNKIWDQSGNHGVILNFLMFGLGDPRHIIKTAAKSIKHNVNINFYVVEGCVELIARNLLLTTIAFENGEDFSIRGKTHLYMDIFGNSLIRPFSSTYICSKAEEMIKIITDFDYANEVAPIFVFEKLKYKERDQLQDTFTFWTNKEGHVFNISQYWDQHLRTLLGNRYDHRKGAFDWDLQMRLKEYGAKQICPQEYNLWRETGIAFTFPEYEQTDPNKTFVVALQKNGSSFSHRGLVGDMNVGPFCAFGLKCTDGSLLKSTQGVNQFRATDITERNLHEFIYEIQEKREYVFDPAHIHEYGSHLLEPVKMLNQDRVRKDNPDTMKYKKHLIKNDAIKITYLSVDDVLNISKKSDMESNFDITVVASNYIPFVNDDFKKVFKQNSLVCFETKQISTKTKTEVNEFLAQIKNLAKSMGLKAVTNFNLNVPCSIVKYKN